MYGRSLQTLNHLAFIDKQALSVLIEITKDVIPRA